MITLDLSVLVTILYLIILFVFMNRVFFKPILHILADRRSRIQGQLEEAQKRIELVNLKTGEYEQALKLARSETYQRQESVREQALAEKADLVMKARHDAERVVQEGKERLSQQAEAARQNLHGEIDTLARRLATVILRDPE